MYHSKDFKEDLNCLALSNSLNKAVTCGENCFKIHDLSDMHEVFSIIKSEQERGKLESIEWSDDGSFLTVATKKFLF